jgi:hypothetical protein
MLDSYLRQFYVSGDCVHFHVLGQSIIVLNSEDCQSSTNALLFIRVDPDWLVIAYLYKLSLSSPMVLIPHCRSWQESCGPFLMFFT